MKKKGIRWNDFFKPDARKLVALLVLIVVSLIGLSIPSLYGHVIPDAMIQGLAIVTLILQSSNVMGPLAAIYFYTLSCVLVWFYERAF
jgi:hypothetical protein